MTNILFFIAGIAFGFYLKGKQSKPFLSDVSKDERDKMQKEAKEALSERTEDRKGKILELMRNENEHRKELQACGLDPKSALVTSEDVKRLLDVSGDTARKYLNELEAEDKIKQVGERGVGVHYVLLNSTVKT